MRLRQRYVSPGRIGLWCSNSCSPCRMREMSTPRSRSMLPVSAFSSRNVVGNVGGAMMSPDSEARPTASSSDNGERGPIARANSLIFPRSTVTVNGAYSLPFTSLFTLIGIVAPLARPARAAGLGRGPREEPVEARHHLALVSPLRDLLHLVPRLHVEETATAVGLAQDGAGPHRHPHRGGREVPHVHRGPDRRAPRRQVGDHHRVGRALEEGEHERGREHGDPGVAQDVGGEVAGDHLMHFGGLSRGERHGGVLFYPDRRATSTPRILAECPCSWRRWVRCSCRSIPRSTSCSPRWPAPSASRRPRSAG